NIKKRGKKAGVQKCSGRKEHDVMMNVKARRVGDTPSIAPSIKVGTQATFHAYCHAKSVHDGLAINANKENACGFGQKHRIDADKLNLKQYVWNKWSNYGLQKVTMINGVFFFKFASTQRFEDVMANGLYMIQNVPIILKKWSPNVSLAKEDLTKVDATCGLKDIDAQPEAGKQKDVEDDGFQSMKGKASKGGKWKIQVR
nr:hypothetical protein [Tanacetum cinerariifolium]